MSGRDKWVLEIHRALVGGAPIATEEFESLSLLRADLAPKFYPIQSSLRLLDLPGWAVLATGAGAEPSA